MPYEDKWDKFHDSWIDAKHANERDSEYGSGPQGKSRYDLEQSAGSCG